MAAPGRNGVDRSVPWERDELRVGTGHHSSAMSEEDLERYESEIELALVQEYRAVVPLFGYVVETERRFYLANTVEVTVRSESSPPLSR